MFDIKHDIKVYQIDTSFYEFKELDSSVKIINYIINQHRESTLNSEEIDHELPSIEIDTVSYHLYVFNTIEKESSWKAFLPSQITKNEDFNVRATSFVLFGLIQSKIFAILGGTGIAVVKRYLNQTFGLDLFEKIADPESDIVTTIESRGIVGNLISQIDTYGNDQKLSNSLSFGRIPHRISIQLREELITDIFDFIEFNNSEKVHANLGSSFHIKWKLSFRETHLLIKRIDELTDLTKSIPLSRFARIRDKNLIDNQLRLQLYQEVRDDMMRIIPPNANPYGLRFDHDFIHPSKSNLFYECDNYALYERGARSPFYETTDKNTLYIAGINFLYHNTDHTNPGDFNYAISGIRVHGYIGHERKTNSMFADNLTCSINFGGRPVFLIDTRWYKVKGDFIKNINDTCIAMIKSNYLKSGILDIPWTDQLKDEEEYNLQYFRKNRYIVLDKILGQNIELCDILYEEDDTIYLIHIKKGFDAKMRDLSNQISISSTRLWNDLNSGKYEFIEAVIDRYNAKNPLDMIELEGFKAKFRKEIIYVMAFNSKLSNNKTVVESIEKIKSNIAKFTLIQSVRDMQTNNYPLKIYEISNQ